MGKLGLNNDEKEYQVEICLQIVFEKYDSSSINTRDTTILYLTANSAYICND